MEADTLEVQVGGNITGSLQINAQNEQISANSMELYTPEDIVKTSSVAVSSSIDSSGGYSVSAFKEEDGRSFGMGYSGSFGGVKDHAFGGKMALSYSDGKGNNLNVQYTNVDWQRVGQIWETSTVLDRVKANISNEVGRFSNYVTNPSSMVTDLTTQFQQLLSGRGSADEILTGVAAGDAIEEEENDGKQEVEDSQFDHGVTVIDINPLIKSKDANYCIIFAYDPTVTPELKLDPKRTGHYYVGSGLLKDGRCVISSLYGMNPANEGMPISVGAIIEENYRYGLAKEYEKKTGQKIIVEKAIPASKKQKEDFNNFIDDRIRSPGTYVGHFEDCISFANETLSILGLKDMRVTDFIKSEEISRYTLAKVSSWLRSLDNKVERDLSRELVASKYKIPLDRIVPLGTDTVTHMPLFRIMPYDDYIKNKKDEQNGKN